VSIFLSSVVLAACATSVVTDPFATETKYWPNPPETKRIAFVGEFSTSSDLGIRESVWGRFVSFTAGSRADVMVRPMAVAATADGKTIFVADPDARCVHRYDLRRGRYTCLVISRRETLVSPIGLAVSNDGWLYVADSRLGHIYRMEIDGKRLEQVQLSAALKQPTGIIWDDSSRLLIVTDTGTQSIKMFNVDGELVREFGARGDSPGHFNYPTYLWVDPMRDLLVTDSLNFRIQRFNEYGEFRHLFGQHGDLAGNLARPKGVATDTFGHVYVIDALFHSLQVFNSDGEFLISVGERGQEPGQFWLPNGVFVSGDNTIYVADSYNKRVQVFRYVGPGK
jgi:sugar lactone lactonase YvrE